MTVSSSVRPCSITSPGTCSVFFLPRPAILKLSTRWRRTSPPSPVYTPVHLLHIPSSMSFVLGHFLIATSMDSLLFLVLTYLPFLLLTWFHAECVWLHVDYRMSALKNIFRLQNKVHLHVWSFTSKRTTTMMRDWLLFRLKVNWSL